MKRSLFISTLILFVLTNCKKDKLTGDAKGLSGKWTWVKTDGGEFPILLTPASTGTKKTLEFKNKGKYEIEKDGKRLEAGRISYSEETNWTGNYFKVAFLRNTLFSKDREFPQESLLRIFGNDSLYITQNANDVPYHIYVRQK